MACKYKPGTLIWNHEIGLEDTRHALLYMYIIFHMYAPMLLMWFNLVC